MKTETRLKADEELAETLAHTLNKSLAEIDDLSLQRLKNARAEALAAAPVRSLKPTYFSSWSIRFGVAASLIMLLAAPVLWQRHNTQQFSDLDGDLVSQEIPPVAQELDDMDMLMAMDDIDA
ncbi:MAG: hypothetical protein V4660_19520 [Pseudomonadota bacterium]